MPETMKELFSGTVDNTAATADGAVELVKLAAGASAVITDIRHEQNGLGDLEVIVDGFSVGKVKSILSGREFVKDAGTIAVKSPLLPIDFMDLRLDADDTALNGLNYQAVRALSNGLGEPGNVSLATGVLSAPLSSDVVRRRHRIPNQDGRFIAMERDDNSITKFRAYAAGAGSPVFTAETSYQPKAYDGERYVYWYDGGNFRRYDTHTLANETTSLGSPGYTGPTTYAKLALIKDHRDVATKKEGLIAFPGNSGVQPLYFCDLINGAASNLGQFFQTGDYYSGSRHWIAERVSDTSFHLVITQTNGTFDVHLFDYSQGATLGNTVRTQLRSNIPMPNIMTVRWSDPSLINGRLYYTTTDGSIASVDLEGKDYRVAIAASDLPIQVTQVGWSIFKDPTPNAATVAARTYTKTPTSRVRIVGVENTASGGA